MFVAAESSSGSPLQLLLFLALPVGLYFLMIRPQKKRMQAQQQLSKSIAEGDEVMTTSGVYGFVSAIEDDVVWLEIADGVDIRITRAAVAKRVTPAAETASDDSDALPAAPDPAN
jgi:preprotein translocase subunit YajC